MRAFHTWGLLALLGAGCIGDDPEAARFILGEAREEDGAPWRRGALALERSVAVMDGGYGYGGYGSQEPLEFEPYGEVPVDPDGRFAVELFAFETSYRVPTTYRVGAPDGGAIERTELIQRWHSFRVRLPLDAGEAWVEAPWPSADTEMPPLRPWTGFLRVEDGPGGSRRLVAPAPPLRTMPRYEHAELMTDTRLEVRSDAGVLWRVGAAAPEPGGDGGLRERPLELELFPEVSEGSGELAVVGVREESGHWGTQEVFGGGLNSFGLHLATPPLVLAHAAGPVPVSRGASCDAFKDPELTPDGGWVCTLTNGAVEAREGWLPDGGFADLPAPVELGRPVQVRLLVLRNVNVAGTVLRAVGRTEQGEEVELARWESLPQEYVDRSLRETHLYLRASVPPGLPPVVGVELRASDPVTPPYSYPGEPPPSAYVRFVGELSVFE